MATAIAHPNIALVKYWGKRDRTLNLPATSSLSLTLAPYETRTTVEVDAEQDECWINGEMVSGRPATRVFEHLDRIDPWRKPATVVSSTNFPVGAGLASSASGFAALTLAASAALVKPVGYRLSILAPRLRCRSPGWRAPRPAGRRLDSTGRPIAPQDHWDVAMVVAVLHKGPR